MTRKQKIMLSITILILGVGITCISYVFSSGLFRGILEALGISILTTAIIDIYEYILNYSKRNASIKSMGLIDVDNNKTSQSQDDIYYNAKKIRVIFSAGSATFRKYQKAIEDSIIKNNCHVKIILSDYNLLKSGLYMSGETEIDITRDVVKNIIEKIKKHNHHGSIELRYSSIAPIGSLEIKDDKFCVVVPYMYKRNSAICYHSTYKNTKNKNDIYHKWEEHFKKVWRKGRTILKYTG